MQIHHVAAGSSESAAQIHIPQKDAHKRPYEHYHDLPPQHQYLHSTSSQHYHDTKPGAVKANLSKSSRPPTGSTSRKQSYKVIVQQNRRDLDLQYVDPPQEFLFDATKESK